MFSDKKIKNDDINLATNFKQKKMLQYSGCYNKSGRYNDAENSTHSALWLFTGSPSSCSTCSDLGRKLCFKMSNELPK